MKKAEGIRMIGEMIKNFKVEVSVPVRSEITGVEGTTEVVQRGRLDHITTETTVNKFIRKERNMKIVQTKTIDQVLKGLHITERRG
jgi:hypothetical protein